MFWDWLIIVVMTAGAFFLGFFKGQGARSKVDHVTDAVDAQELARTQADNKRLRLTLQRYRVFAREVGTSILELEEAVKESMTYDLD